MASVLTFPDTILYGYANTFHMKDRDILQSMDIQWGQVVSPVGSPLQQHGLFGDDSGGSPAGSAQGAANTAPPVSRELYAHSP